MSVACPDGVQSEGTNNAVGTTMKEVLLQINTFPTLYVTFT